MEAAGYQQQPTLLAPLLSLANPQQPFEPNNGGGSSGGDWTTVLCDLRRSVSNLVLYVLESMPVPWLLTSATTTSAPPPMLPPTPAPATALSATVTQPPSYQLQEVDELDDGGKRARRFNWPDCRCIRPHPRPFRNSLSRQWTAPTSWKQQPWRLRLRQPLSLEKPRKEPVLPPPSAKTPSLLCQCPTRLQPSRTPTQELLMMLCSAKPLCKFSLLWFFCVLLF